MAARGGGLGRGVSVRSGESSQVSDVTSSRATAGEQSGETGSMSSGKKRPRSNSFDNTRLSNVYETHSEGRGEDPFADDARGHYPSPSLGAAVTRQANAERSVSTLGQVAETTIGASSPTNTPTRSRILSGPRGLSTSASAAPPALSTSISSPSLREIGGPRPQPSSPLSPIGTGSWRPSPRVASASERAQQELQRHSRNLSGSGEGSQRGSNLRVANPAPEADDAEVAANADELNQGMLGWPKFLRF